MTDGELIAQIQSGKEELLEVLVSRYYLGIQRYCFWHVKSKEEAEDLSQEAFLRVVRALPHFRIERPFRPWLYTIAKNLCIDRARSHAKQAQLGNALQQEETVSTLDDLQQVENRQMLEVAIRQLPTKQQEAIYLRYGHDLTIKEVAQVQKIPLRTAQYRINTALKMLRKMAEGEIQRDG